MIRLLFRCIALAIAASALLYDWSNGRNAFGTLIVCGSACLFIWFPEFIDDVTFGTTRAGYKIDTHTPAWLIESVGWILLGLHASLRFYPRWISKLFGM